jgi:hypothetical protein
MADMAELAGLVEGLVQSLSACNEFAVQCAQQMTLANMAWTTVSAQARPGGAAVVASPVGRVP